ncbi:MAG: thermonuclease family protein [Cyanobacteria bacterium J06576_12]
MKSAKAIRTTLSLLLLAVAITAKISPQWVERLTSPLEPEYSGNSESYTLVPGSIYDGDTFQVSNGVDEIKVRLCGVDAPEKDQALGTESRDHLRSLIAQGRGRVTLIKTDTDQYGRTIAEVFIPTGNGEEEIHVNSQMVADGMAYVYPQYVGSCPNAEPMKIAERVAKDASAGVWANPVSQKPWEYRRRS